MITVCKFMLPFSPRSLASVTCRTCKRRRRLALGEQPMRPFIDAALAAFVAFTLATGLQNGWLTPRSTRLRTARHGPGRPRTGRGSPARTWPAYCCRSRSPTLARRNRGDSAGAVGSKSLRAIGSHPFAHRRIRHPALLGCRQAHPPACRRPARSADDPCCRRLVSHCFFYRAGFLSSQRFRSRHISSVMEHLFSHFCLS
jgi:hypothetical protein